MTVTEGTINGLIVYANVMYCYQDLIPNRFHSSNRIFWVFIALLNLDSVLEMCFYKGMDSYQLIWLQYGYTFYLIMLHIIIVLLCRRSVLFTRLFRRNVLQVLATLMFLAYSPVMRALVYTFSIETLYVYLPNGTKFETRYILTFDGDVTYLRAKHIPLFIVGLICITIPGLFTLSLLLNQCLQRRSNIFCFRWIERWRPFIEAYTGPCHDNRRFWPGFLMVMRLLLVLLTTSTKGSKYYVIASGVTALCVIIMSLLCIFPLGMYKKRLLNVLEFSFFLNLFITSIILNSYKPYVEIVFHISVAIALLTFLGILFYHIFVRLKVKSHCFKCAGNLKRNVSGLTQKVPHIYKQQIASCCCRNESGDTDETTYLVSPTLSPK